MSMALTVSGLPIGSSLADLEGLVLPRITGRIVAIGLRGEGKGQIELSSASDADAVVGAHELMGAKVYIAHDAPVAAELLSAAVPSSNKRTRSGVPADPIAPAPISSTSNDSTLISSTTGDDDDMGEAGASSRAMAGSEPDAAMGDAGSSTEAGSVPPSLTTQESTASLADVEELAAAAAAVSQAADAGAPNAKRQKAAETKKEKERRLNRVGLSYRCGRCGMPKKGHVCTGVARESEDSDVPLVPQGKSKAPADNAEGHSGGSGGGSGSAAGSTTSPAGSWDLDSESIFKDIKSVLQTPAGGGTGGSSKSNGEKKKGGGSKRTKAKATAAAAMPADIMPPPPALPPHAAERAAEKSALLEELDIAMQRPPSVITPDDGEGGRGAVGGPSSLGAPSSLVSASDMFSPGQLMTHLLGTPTPAITPGLSPGTLNELGNMLQSPAAMAASAQKVAGGSAPPGAVETPSQ